jgi:hypothetical protein
MSRWNALGGFASSIQLVESSRPVPNEKQKALVAKRKQGKFIIG